MAVGTTAAILGGAALGAGASALSSRSASKQAQAQRDYLEEAQGPARALQAAQLEDYYDIYRPQAQTQRDIYQQYAKPQAETSNRIFQEGADLYSDVYFPTTRTLNDRLRSDLDRSYELPTQLSDKYFNTAKRRISESYAPIREQTSQRLAGSGSLGTGIAEQAFQGLDEGELQSLEDAAFQQALAEFDIERTGRQQSLENVFSLLGMQRTPSAPGVSPAATNTGAVGGTLPYAAQMYTPIPKAGIDFSQVVGGGLAGAELAGGFGVPVTYGSAGYRGAGYANYPDLYRDLYGGGF